MKKILCVSALIACLISFSSMAVNAPPTETTAAAAHPMAPTNSTNILTQVKTLTQVKKGMAYADFRQAALGQGWKPTIDKECKPNVVGGSYKELCAGGADSCKACDELPELSACSGDGDCLMNFHNESNHQTMEVTTYGDIRDRNTHGNQSNLDVTGWDIKPTH
jgi:hypothetical protein